MHACRLCDSTLSHSVVDLGSTPLANSYIPEHLISAKEPFFPLHAQVCEQCWLVQIPECAAPEEIFSDYAYFSSYSDSWLAHAAHYASDTVSRLGLGGGSLVVELASNDGYLLQAFQKLGVPCLGVEPAANVAAVAIEKSIPTQIEFFTERVAKRMAAQGQRADLVVANNVLAQVPDLKDFTRGIRALLKPEGVVTVEFPHWLQTLEKNEFDTVYHEHFSYFSLHSARAAFLQAGIRLFDVEPLPTHGGSLRVWGCLEGAGRPEHASIAVLLEQERQAGLLSAATYARLQHTAEQVKQEFTGFLATARDQGKKVAAYGAPAKGNTLLNFCGVTPQLLPFTVDRNPHKQGCLLPGTRIPVRAPEALLQSKPDYLVILPWNLSEEIMRQCAYIRDWGGRFVVPIPRLEVL